MKEVAWVFGRSASGKETFINYLTSNQPSEIAGSLGWAHKHIGKCQESLEYVAQSDNDKMVEKRDSILESVPGLIDSCDVILIKWQYVDSETDRPQRLKALIPEALHRIILIETEPSERMKRLRSKAWWGENYILKTFDTHEQGLIVSALGKLSTDFDVTTIKSHDLGNYELM